MHPAAMKRLHGVRQIPPARPPTCQQQLPAHLQLRDDAACGRLDALEAVRLVKDARDEGDAAQQALLLRAQRVAMQEGRQAAAVGPPRCPAMRILCP